MTAVPDRASITDGELAAAAAVGDRGAFAGIYDRYADRLHDFCIGMLNDRDAAADCVQDTFCTAATGLAQLRNPDRLRPWLYAIARNEALRRIGQRRREQPYEYLPDAVSGEPGPDVLAARSELADLIGEAAGGLSDRDRTVLELAYRHGLDGADLAEALGVSPASARTLTHRMRETIERSLGALLLARGARAGRGCPELAALLSEWDGQFTILIRKRIARHIDSCVACERDRRRLISPTALLGSTPVVVPAPGWLRDRTLDRVRFNTAGPGGAGTGTNQTARPLQTAPAAAVGIAKVDTSAGGPVAASANHELTPDFKLHPANSRLRRAMVFMALGAATLITAADAYLVVSASKDAPKTPDWTTATTSQTSQPTTPAIPTPASPPPASASTTPTTTDQLQVPAPEPSPAGAPLGPTPPPSPSTTAGTTSVATTTTPASTAPTAPTAPATPTTALPHHDPKPPPKRHGS
ncbi:hypothetical protein BOO86_13205 [Mycobacterium sp. CBMA 234]|uniref:RNA polymerase sigma factor n=1 Tax=Mycolicibacterium sp. CBMA 234 TaxID=1918495 RepID=UPI001EE43C4A|nr:sigma-70 family RNA polymerase sigma factor [Mycolicibacterium sp. CBMA 234]MUL65429.1 hypothetical protein [Mycolicibacterium sp. CBMA 234]